jgi:hypothetical protein
MRQLPGSRNANALPRLAMRVANYGKLHYGYSTGHQLSSTMATCPRAWMTEDAAKDFSSRQNGSF